MVSSLLSFELFFWFPALIDLLLLSFTYPTLRLKGKEWYFANSLPDSAKKTYLEGKSPISSHAEDLIDSVWSLAMIAYSAYACTYPFAIYWCYHLPELRPSFSSVMTALMLFKLEGLNKSPRTAFTDSKNLTLIFMYLPTYGTYAVVKMLEKQ